MFLKLFRLCLIGFFSVFFLFCAIGKTSSNNGPQLVKTPYLHNEMTTDKLKLFKETVAHQAKAFPNYFFLESSSYAKDIALTFDDGPEGTYTPQVLSVLKEYNVKATFFFVASRAEAYPEVTKRAKAEGHAIGMHGYEHLDLRTMSTIYAYDSQVWRAERAFKNILGVTPAFFRPPYGAITDEQIPYFGERGVKVIDWSIDSFDWDNTQNSVEEITGKVLKYAHEGAIVLMHSGNNKANTVKSLPIIIKALRERGYTFKTVPEMLGIPEYLPAK